MFGRAYKWTGIEFESRPNGRMLRCTTAGTYKHRQFGCLTPRPECGARGVVSELGAGQARRPALFRTCAIIRA